MTTVQEQIEAQRADISKARAQALELTKREQISRAQLQRRGMLASAKARAEIARRQKYAKARLGDIAKAEKAFETEVSKYQAQVSAVPTAQPSTQYQYAKRQAQQWAQAEKIMSRGSRYDPRSAVGKKIQKLYRHRDEAMQDIAKAQAKLATPSQVSIDSQIQSILNKPHLTSQDLFDIEVLKGKAKQVVSVGSGIDTRGIDVPRMVSPTPSFLQPGYVSPEMRKILPPKMIQKFEAQQLETKRYQDLGYTPSQASKLAIASLARGGMTFTPDYAKKIIKPTFKEKVRDYRDMKEFERKPEIYDPRTMKVNEKEIITGVYQTSPYGLGAGGTVIMRQPTYAEQIKILEAQERPREIYEKVGEVLKTGIEKAPPVLDMPYKPVLGYGPLGELTPERTIGETLAVPAEAIELVAETAAEGWEDIYGTALEKIPKKNWPGRWIGGEYEVKPEKGTKAWADAIDAGKVRPITKEQVGAGVEMGIKGLTYVVPVVGPTYMGSEFFKGVETVKHPEAEARKILKEQYKEYEKQYAESKKTLEPGYELEKKLSETEYVKEHVPGIIERVKFGGAVEAGTSLLFLGGVGAFKAGKQIIRATVPRAKYFGATTKQYDIAIKEAEKELVKLGKQDIVWVGKIEKEGGRVFIRGEQKLGKLKRDVKVYGELKKTETGKVFIPYGEGEIKGGGEMFLGKGKKKISYEYLEAQKFEVGADAISVRAGELVSHPKLIEKIPSKIKLLRESSLLPEKVKPMFAKAEKALAKKVKVIPEQLAKAETYKIIGKTTTIPKVGTFALYKKPGYLTPSARVRKVVKKQMEKNIYFGGDVVKDISPQIAIKLKPKVFLVSERKGAGLFFVKEAAKKEARYGVRLIGGKKTSFAKIYEEVKQVPTLIRTLKVPKPIKLVSEVKPLDVTRPFMVGGVGLKTLPAPSYALAEVEVEVGAVLMPSVIKPSLVPRVDVTPKPRVDVVSISKVGVITLPKVREELKYEAKLKLEPLQVMDIKEVQVLREIPRMRLLPRERVILRERLVPKLAQVPRQVQIQREVIKQVPVIRPVPKPRIRPPTLRPVKIIPIVRLWKKSIEPVKLRKPVPERGYTYEVRRKGKWQRAKLPFAFATEAGAEAMAQEKVLKEAAASYKVVKARVGKKVVRTRKKPSVYRKVLFRKAKKEPGVMVQKKLLRILSEGEKREISYAGGLARMKKAKTSFYKQPIITPVKKRKVTKKKKKGGKK